MSLATVLSRAPAALQSPLVRVEVHLAPGLPAINLVGLPEKAVKESKDRVRAALANSGLVLPPRHITINLAPADLPKDGSRYDLPIALGLLQAVGALPDFDPERFEFHGELALSGALRPTGGILPAALAAREAGRIIVVPPENLAEAQLIHPEARAVASLGALLAVLRGEGEWLTRAPPLAVPPAPVADFSEVLGQHQAKRALLIASAGGHHLLMFGAPGTGKSMLAARLAGILPPMSEAEAIETATLQSLSSQGFDPAQWQRRPYRAPHHSSSASALAGGGSYPRPGEISLAHHGVLFLDELPEFDRRVLEMLREPLETGVISISRVQRKCDFPARFQLVAAMNPCPCGYHGDPERPCQDSPERVRRYRQRISGPLLDRIDLRLHIPRLTPRQLREQAEGAGASSAELQAAAQEARERQLHRQGKANAALGSGELSSHLRLAPEAEALLDRAAEQLHLSMRSYQRLLRVARTIADLAASDRIGRVHLAEALSYRTEDF